MKQVSLCLALIVAFVNAASAQVVDATQVGNSVMINLNYQSLDSIIRALESRIESLEGTQDLDGDGVRSNQDCDDDDAAVGAERLWYQDVDGDLYGGVNSMLACTQPPGYVAVSGDCDDTESSINPGAADVCGSGIDQNCDNVFSEYPIFSASVTISPGGPIYSNMVLTGTAAATDPTNPAGPGGPVTLAYEWKVDGTTVGTSSTIDLSDIDVSSASEVVVIATATTSSGCSSFTSASVVVENSLPTAPDVSIVGTPSEGGTLIAVVVGDSADLDGDPVTYQYAWFVDGVPTSCNTDTYCLSMTLGDTITVLVTPNDGIGSGTSASASVVVVP